MVVTDQIKEDVLKSYSLDIHEAPIVAVPHEDTTAGFKTKNREGEALGWVKELGEVEWQGERVLAITDAVPSSPEHEQEIVRLLKGPMKNNSPEIFHAERILTELYSPETTSHWPDEVKQKPYLRRVNLCGETPIAQFGMPQAYVLADGEQYIQIPFQQEKQQQPVAEWENFICSECGGKNMGKENEKPTNDGGVDTSAAMTAAGVKELQEKMKELALKLQEAEDLKKAEAEKANLAAEEKKEAEGRIARAEAELKRRGDELDAIRKRERRRELEVQVDKMVDAGTLPVSKHDIAIQLAEIVEERFGRDTKIMLSEGNELPSADAVLEALSLPQSLVGQSLRVLGEKGRPTKDEDFGLTLSERQQKAIEKAAEENKIDLAKGTVEQDRAYAIAYRKNPALFRQTLKVEGE